MPCTKHEEIAAAQAAERETMARRRAAYELIVLEHERALLRYALRITFNRSAVAEEYVQEALVRGYEAFLDGRFQEGSNARAWLFKILTNRFLSAQRQNRFLSNESLEDLCSTGQMPTSLQTSPREDPGWLLLSQTFSEPIERALAALPDDLRVAVLLVDVEEMTYVEAANVCQIPVGTIRSRLFRARRELALWLTTDARQRRASEHLEGDR